MVRDGRAEIKPRDACAMKFDQFHRGNVAQLWREWIPPKDLPKWESGACFIAFIRERYDATKNRAAPQPSFEQTKLFDGVE